jgi:anion-transporting  ArsA/GET3 family ATPase
MEYSHAGRVFLHDYDPLVPANRATPSEQRPDAGSPARAAPAPEPVCSPRAAPRLAEQLAGKRVCVCVGPGGVGKTTTAAALALGLARRGQRVAVVTIDPARRLASALGIEELDNEPRRIDPALLAAQGVAPWAHEQRASAAGASGAPGELWAHEPHAGAGEAPGAEGAPRAEDEPGGEGELWATMLDAKGTFDALIARLAPTERAREEVMANRIYREISSAVAGTQEFSAIAKLYELHHEGDFDIVVLDTPPSHNALDFLDAPGRMARFLEGRALRIFLAPGNLAARVVGRGSGLVLSVLARFTGADLLGELSGFFGALAGMVDGFRERAHAVEGLLRDPATAFVLVTSPEREQAREAALFAERLAAAGMTRTAVVVNRVHRDGLEGHSPAQVRALLASELGERLAARVAANLADFDVLARRDWESIAQLSASLGDPHPIVVPHLDGDVRDLAGLHRIAEVLLP